jgi:ribonuclease E
MSQQIVIAEQLRIAAVLSDERVDELIVAQGRYQIGDVYLGTVENVLPGIDAAFVNIGESEKNGFIHVTDLGPLRLKKGSAGITELLEPRQKVLGAGDEGTNGNKGATTHRKSCASWPIFGSSAPWFGGQYLPSY